MSTEAVKSTIPFEDCWEMRRGRFSGNPVRYDTITVDGVATRLRNLRPTLGSFSSERHIPPATEQQATRNKLVNTIRDADGYLGRFEREKTWADAMRRYSIRPGDSPESISLSKRALEIARRNSRADFSNQLDELNAAAQTETGLWLAFLHPDNPRPRATVAVARFAGVEFDETRHDLAIAPLVLGKSALEGGAVNEPLSIPRPYFVAWPLFEAA
jgi:hypothetical protein